jgi:hypothetical protein
MERTMPLIELVAEERSGALIGDILTLDRDFAVYRWGRNKAFRMLPNEG